jgi:hypothetical protein
MKRPGARIQETGAAMGREEYWNNGMMGLSDKNPKIVRFHRVA